MFDTIDFYNSVYNLNLKIVVQGLIRNTVRIDCNYHKKKIFYTMQVESYKLLKRALVEL